MLAAGTDSKQALADGLLDEIERLAAALNC
jgi:ribosomal protein S12 methylthiotransferase accessory factor YcaO